MNEFRPRIAVLITLGLALGVGLGLYIGWRVWPVQYTNTTPLVLRRDYQDDYVVMVATAYAVEGDLEQAIARLRVLDLEQPGRPVVDLAETLIEANGSPQDITYLARLARDLGAGSVTLLQYTGESP